MSMSDVFAVTKTADATVYDGRVRVRQIQIHIRFKQYSVVRNIHREGARCTKGNI